MGLLPEAETIICGVDVDPGWGLYKQPFVLF
jgi:hypothetical protein